MVTPRATLGASRRLILSFVLVLLVPALAVVWLGVRLIEQDRAIASCQLQERRESAADRFVAGLEQAVSSTERRLDGEPTALGIRSDDDAVLLILRPSGIEAYPTDRLLYVPPRPAGPAELTEAFEAGFSTRVPRQGLSRCRGRVSGTGVFAFSSRAGGRATTSGADLEKVGPC